MFKKRKQSGEKSSLLVNDDSQSYGSLSTNRSSPNYFEMLGTKIGEVFAELYANREKYKLSLNAINISLNAVANTFNAFGVGKAIETAALGWRNRGEKVFMPAMYGTTILMIMSALLAIMDIAEIEKRAKQRKDVQIVMTSFSQVLFVMQSLISVIVLGKTDFGKHNREVGAKWPEFLGIVLASGLVGFSNSAFNIAKNHQLNFPKFFDAVGKTTSLIAYSTTINSLISGIAENYFNFEETEHPLAQVLIYVSAIMGGVASSAFAFSNEKASEKVFKGMNIISFWNLLNFLIFQTYHDFESKDKDKNDATNQIILLSLWIVICLTPVAAQIVKYYQNGRNHNLDFDQFTSDVEGSPISDIKEPASRVEILEEHVGESNPDEDTEEIQEVRLKN